MTLPKCIQYLNLQSVIVTHNTAYYFFEFVIPLYGIITISSFLRTLSPPLQCYHSQISKQNGIILNLHGKVKHAFQQSILPTTQCQQR